MRGYLNFLLVFISVFFILILFAASETPSSISLSKAISAERIYQAQMNSKEMVNESIRKGGIAAFAAYNSTHFVFMCDPDFGGPADPACFRMEEAALWTRAGAFTYLVLADSSQADPDIQQDFFCMPSINDILSRQLAMQNLPNYPGLSRIQDPAKNFSDYSLFLIASADKDKSGNPVYSTISLPPCMEMIYPVIEEDPANALISDPKLKRNPELKRIRLVNGFIGIYAISEKLNITSVAYLPAGSEVVP